MPGSATNPYYVMEKTGRILRLPADTNSTSTTLFLDLRNVVSSAGEGGIYNMVFHPQYPKKPYVYVSHMVDEGGFLTRISRFTTLDGMTASDEKILFNLPLNPSPIGQGSIHLAGTMAFGPDGYLYMSVGDNKRTTAVGVANQLYGSIIRINVDVDESLTYAIPDKNPYQNEVFAYGFRNPWRISFDRATGDLWAGDVGEECFEEINRVELGRNYGWPNWEGDICGPGGCKGDNTLPVYKYHTAKTCGPGNSVTGGYVYRGQKNPKLVGKYIYGDYQTGLVWAYDIKNGFNEDLFVDGRGSGIAAFGEDNSGELYHIDIVQGRISRLDPGVNTTVAGGPAQNLADTQCFKQLANTLEPSEGVIGYDIAQPFWSDGAVKERFLSLPAATTFNIDAAGDWELPLGGVLIKNFKWLGKNIETRFVVRYNNGAYGAYTYEWTSENAAVLVPSTGKDTILEGGTAWRYPSRNECFQCHTTRAGYILGPETRQMNIDHYFPTTKRIANQFKTLDALGMLSGTRTAIAPFPAVDDMSKSLNSRALAYLHVNCASCHRGTGGAQSIWDARITTSLANKGLCGVTPIKTVTNSPSKEHYINPGDHLTSSIWWRVQHRGQDQMPPLVSTIADSLGTNLLANWIDGLSLIDCQSGL